MSLKNVISIHLVHLLNLIGKLSVISRLFPRTLNFISKRNNFEFECNSKMKFECLENPNELFIIIRVPLFLNNKITTSIDFVSWPKFLQPSKLSLPIIKARKNS